MSCLCHYGPPLLRFWLQAYLGHENSASYLKIQAGKTFSYHGHALVTLYVQFLYSDWSKFDRWVHAASWKLFTLTAEADRVLCQLVMFLTVFSTGCTKWNTAAIKSIHLIHGWFVYWAFGCEMRRLSKPIILFRMASVLFFTLLDAYKNYKGSSDPCLTW